jgi:hypothetical protein
MTFSRKSRRVLIVIALVFGAAGFRIAINSLAPPNVYRKDFMQEYLLARAVRAGINPYLHPPQLAERVNLATPEEILRHPTPHPPPLAFISLPLAWMSYERAAATWLAVELLCLLASVALLLRWWNRKPGLPLTRLIALIALITLITWTALGWGHVWEDLALGQVGLILLALLTGAWLALRADKQILGGALLGVSIALKLICWPLMFCLLLRRKLIAAITAGASLFAANLLAVIAIGWDVVIGYYTQVGPLVASLYRAYIRNLSLWSVTWRLFDGTGSPVLVGTQAPPLIYAPTAARLLVFAPPLILLLAGLRASVISKSFDAAYGLMICVSLLVSPLLWSHYLSLMAIPAVVIARGLYELGFPCRPTVVAIALALSLLIPGPTLVELMRPFVTATDSQGNQVAPFAATMISLIPTVATLGCFLLLRRLSNHLDFTSVNPTEEKTDVTSASI